MLVLKIVALMNLMLFTRKDMKFPLTVCHDKLESTIEEALSKNFAKEYVNFLARHVMQKAMTMYEMQGAILAHKGF